METTDSVVPTTERSDISRRKVCRHGGASLLLMSFFLGVFGGILGWWVGPRVAHDLKLPMSPAFLEMTKNAGNIGSKDMSATLPPSVSSEESLLVSLVEKSTSGVVSVVISKDVPKYRSFFDDPSFPSFFFGRPFGGDANSNQGETEKQTIGEGSGFFVSSDGTIVTNKHVVEDLQADYTVITSDKKEHVARVLARDPVQDIAILKIDGDGFPALDLGDSENLRVGQTAVAIGNSLGEFSNTVSRGIISGLQRSLVAGSGMGASERLSGIIQTDAAINPGNSGGPLLDLSGNVIGINVAMAQGAQNIGFAIPVNSIKHALDEVRNTGKISAPFLGVRSVAITPEIQKANNLPFAYGALIVRGQNITDLAVVPGSPADKADIVENDIVLEIDGTKIDTDAQLADVIASKHAGDTVTLKVWHKGDTRDVDVTLEERK
ncbi:MAG: trypsin-like peptidase domain-containing protein [Candidatus Moraniibacteriota bacterium]|nr:MAG: trypsin-like peptidase domain-containing protein [Candidatus Moranbacteria bacterium]